MIGSGASPSPGPSWAHPSADLRAAAATPPGEDTASRTFRVLDPIEALELLGGDRPLLDAVTKQFLGRLDGLFADLVRGIAAGDGPATAESAHALLGPVRQFQAPRFSDLLADLQQIGEEGAFSLAPELLAKLAAELPRFRTELEWILDPTSGSEAASGREESGT